ERGDSWYRSNEMRREPNILNQNYSPDADQGNLPPMGRGPKTNLEKIIFGGLTILGLVGGAVELMGNANSVKMSAGPSNLSQNGTYLNQGGSSIKQGGTFISQGQAANSTIPSAQLPNAPSSSGLSRQYQQQMQAIQ